MTRSLRRHVTMLSRYLKLIDEATESAGFEPRTLLISTILLVISAYSFDPYVSAFVIIVSFVFGFRKAVSAILAASPFLILLSVLSYKVVTAVALVCVGSLIYGTTPEEFGYALSYFRIPAKISNSIVVSMRMFRILVKDLERIYESVKMEGTSWFSRYRNLLKALTLTAMLRALSISEALYSRGFRFDSRVYITRSPGRRDYALLIASLSLFLYTYLIRNAL